MIKRSTEKMFNSLHDHRRGLIMVRDGLMLVRSSGLGEDDVLDPNGRIAHRIKTQLEGIDRALERIADDLAIERKAYVKQEREKDEWASPSCRDGWLCVDSPSGVCQSKHSRYDPDYEDCSYCHFPDKRK